MKNFKYLGVYINNENNKNVEIKQKIQTGKKLYYVHKTTLEELRKSECTVH